MGLCWGVAYGIRVEFHFGYLLILFLPLLYDIMIVRWKDKSSDLEDLIRPAALLISPYPLTPTNNGVYFEGGAE